MFQSVKWRLITIYLVLELIVLSIVSSFIVNRLETEQIGNISKNMEANVNSLISSSFDVFNEDLYKNKNKIDELINNWRLSSNESIYVITSEKEPVIISSNTNARDYFLNNKQNALTYKNLEPDLILQALQGKKAESLVENKNTSENTKHLLKPIISDDGEVKGLIYEVCDLQSVYNVLNYAKNILTSAIIFALVITLVLAYILAGSITRPIKDLTLKAKEMAKGDFNQRVEVKSDDEIGKLGNTFNYLTDELNLTIDKMNIEKSKLNTIFDYMAEGVIAVNRNGILIHANPIAKKILNLNDKSIGSPIDLIRVNIDKLNYSDYKSLKGEKNLDLNNNFYKVKFAPYKSEGLNSGIIVVLQDITKEHKLDLMRREFVANVSHELKTPITTIMSYTETLLDVDLDENGRKNFLKVIERENKRMARLVSDLLQLSNMDYKETNWKYEAIDTYDFISENAESLEVLLNKKRQKLTLDIPKNINKMFVDRHGADQVFRNILANAINYTEDMGKIEVKARSLGANVTIEVKDNGVGIAKEDLNRIFDRFYRVEKSRSRAMGGTGLGLSIAKEIIESMGGSIKIESVLNEGTKVTLSFAGVLWKKFCQI